MDINPKISMKVMYSNISLRVKEKEKKIFSISYESIEKKNITITFPRLIINPNIR